MPALLPAGLSPSPALALIAPEPLLIVYFRVVAFNFSKVTSWRRWRCGSAGLAPGVPPCPWVKLPHREGSGSGDDPVVQWALPI